MRYENKNSSGVRAGRRIQRAFLRGRRFAENIRKRGRRRISGIKAKRVGGKQVVIANRPVENQAGSAWSPRRVYTADTVALPRLNVSIPTDFVWRDDQDIESTQAGIDALTVYGKAFDRHITYTKAKGMMDAINRNWQSGIESLYAESKGWLAGECEKPVEFSVYIATPHEMRDQFGEEWGDEEFEHPLLMIAADCFSAYDIEAGLNHLRGFSGNLDDVALVLLDKSPVSIYTPCRMYDEIVQLEWLGEDNESARLEELAYCGSDEEYDGLTKAELLKVYPEWMLWPSRGCLENSGEWGSFHVPDVLIGLNRAINKWDESCFTPQGYGWGLIPCAAVYCGGNEGWDIMSRTLDNGVDLAQQCGACEISPHIIELNPDNADEVLEHIHAYLDCVFWTGELLNYLQGYKVENECKVQIR